MNTLSFYNHWGFHAPWPDAVKFEGGAHDIARLYEISQNVGLWCSARPGPYINAGLNGGGHALWSTTGEYGTVRDNSTKWTVAWKLYTDKFDEITARYQASENGTVVMYQIENEFARQWKDANKKFPNEVQYQYGKYLPYFAARRNTFPVSPRYLQLQWR
ncbi:hypothetical protein FOPG_14620 [Fusarium oxysporum f. sp. conglutinans race 2 54008]|nr:hypothetical protein FOPG_14620 [Fusarium oxysporum f. sp. conglutinans race 2 54008]